MEWERHVEKVLCVTWEARRGGGTSTSPTCAFSGDSALAGKPADLRLQADALGRVVADKRYFETFGLAPPDGEEFRPRCIQSICTARRVGPDGQVRFDLVAEVTRGRRIRMAEGTPATFHGGATVIVDPEGSVRYAIVKNIRSVRRLEEYRPPPGGGGTCVLDSRRQRPPHPKEAAVRARARRR